MNYRNEFQAEKISANKTTGLVSTTQSLQPVPEMEVLLKLDHESAGEVTANAQRSRASKSSEMNY